MTLYQQLEHDLLDCGWARSQGKGDHMKFTKSGVPTIITISRSICGRGCALQNCLARIRKYEPNFWRDRPEETQTEAPLDLGAFPDIKPWMYPGETVRWTAAENKDYAKLADKDSVMNVRYVVVEIVPVSENEAGKARLTISPGGDDDQAFQVVPDDVDSWEIATCAVCGKKFPANRLCTSDRGLICADCVPVVLAQKAGVKVPAPRVCAKDVDIEETPDIPGFEVVKEIEKEYKNTPIKDLPDEAKRRLREAFEKLPAKSRKGIKRFYPEVYAMLDTAGKEKIYAYDAWKLFASEFAARKRPRSQKEFQSFVKRFCSGAHYVPRNRKFVSGAMLVYDIMVDDYDLFLDIWAMSSKLLVTMYKAHQGEDVAFRIICQKKNICQYLVPPCGERSRALVESFRKELPEKEKDQLARAELDARLVDYISVRKTVDACLEEVLEGKRAEDGSVPFVVHVGLALRDCDREQFETAKPFYDIDVEYNGDVFDEETLARAGEKMRDADFGVPYAYSFSERREDDRGERILCFGDYFAQEDGDSATEADGFVEEVYGPDPGQTLIKVANVNGGLGFYLASIDEKASPEVFADYFERLTAVFTEIITNSVEADVLRRALRFAIESVRGGEKMKDKSEDERRKILAFWDGALNIGGINSNKKNNENMKNDAMNNNYLDLTNPNAENKAAGALTTRELLRELKARGVSFDGIQITIKSDINIDEI